MNTLEKLLKQDLLLSKEHEKLLSLQRQYVTEEAKYSPGRVVLFRKFRDEPALVLGKIERVYYNELGGVYDCDRPDFADAYIERAEYEGRELTADELEHLTELVPDYINQKANER